MGQSHVNSPHLSAHELALPRPPSLTSSRRPHPAHGPAAIVPPLRHSRRDNLRGTSQPALRQKNPHRYVAAGEQITSRSYRLESHSGKPTDGDTRATLRASRRRRHSTLAMHDACGAFAAVVSSSPCTLPRMNLEFAITVLQQNTDTYTDNRASRGVLSAFVARNYGKQHSQASRRLCHPCALRSSVLAPPK